MTPPTRSPAPGAPAEPRASAAQEHGQTESRAPFCGNEEPSLSELLGDPIVRCLMERDGVQMIQLLKIISEARKTSG